MRLDLGTDVHRTDAPFGELADVIVDPISRRVTHVVAPHGHHEHARLVPIQRVRPAGDGLAIDPDPHVMVSFDRIPKNEVEIRRTSAVISTDGHHLGHVDGFLIGEGGAADIVVISGDGARWSSPASAVERVRNDSITLSLTKEEVAQPDARHVHRWF